MQNFAVKLDKTDIPLKTGKVLKSCFGRNTADVDAIEYADVGGTDL